jgi:hypothetical protein
MVEEEEEEAGCFRPKRRRRTCITTLWCHVYDHLAKLFMICFELCILRSRWSYFSVSWAVCCRKATNSLYWVLDTNWELPMIDTLRVARKFSAVMLESPYTRFLSGSPDDPTSIHKSKSKSEWVEGLSPYISLNRLL